MLAILKCIGVYTQQDQDETKLTDPEGGAWYARGHKDADQLRREAEAAAERAEVREQAKATVRTQLRKESRRGIGLLSVRNLFVSDDEQALVYAKPGAKAAEKTLPFATMEQPVVEGATISITMRDQPKSASTYKFSAANDRDAQQWADAVSVFVRPPTSKVPSAAPEALRDIASAA